MSIKVDIKTYKDNPMATFWSRLGSFLSYLSPIIGFCVLFAGLPIADKHHFGTLFWIAWGALSIIAAIVFFIIVIAFCGNMEMKAIQKNMPKQDLINYTGAGQITNDRVHPDFSIPPSGDTMNLTKTVEEVKKKLEENVDNSVKM